MPSCNTYHLTWVSLLGTGYLFTAAPAKHSRLSLPWTRGISLPPPFLTFKWDSSSRPSCAAQSPLLGLLLPAAGPGLGRGWLLPVAAPGLVLGVAPQGHCPWPWVRGGFSWPHLISDVGCLLPAASDLGLRVAPLARSCAVAAWHSRPLPMTLYVG